MQQSIEEYIVALAQRAKKASRQLAQLTSAQKDEALEAMAQGLEAHTAQILAENAKDMAAGRENGLSAALLDRLALDENRLAQMADGLRSVKALEDPVGEVEGMVKRPNGLLIGCQRVPMGVVAIIYEARPNVTSDVAGLCIKSGNAAILRGGKEALHSNLALSKVLRDALKGTDCPEDALLYIDQGGREATTYLMQLNGLVDVLIPRGGAGLIQHVVKNATVPVIETGVGNCHVFIDETAKIDQAIDIVINSKTTRPAVCNALETLLVHRSIAAEFLPRCAQKLKEKGVEIRGCQRTREWITDAFPASEEDYATEFLDLILAVRVVDGLDEAIAHVQRYSTGHSECIVTENYSNAQAFLQQVDAAAVYVNASTRFTDGFEFGLGAEIGISTQKLHARGPMGLKALTTTKYIIYGSGQIR